jgi:hypothetical protein
LVEIAKSQLFVVSNVGKQMMIDCKEIRKSPRWVEQLNSGPEEIFGFVGAKLAAVGELSGSKR